MKHFLPKKENANCPDLLYFTFVGGVYVGFCLFVFAVSNIRLRAL
jgi:hypothetical protein